MAERHVSGTCARQLSIELSDRLHPWAMAFAAAQSSGLPAHADRNEVVSRVLEMTWDACRRIDWARYQEWPAYLESKVSRARIEAARADDWLSRGERTRRRRYQNEIARREQLAGRPLGPLERVDVATEVAPSSTRVDWAKELLAARHPSSVSDVPETIGDGTVEELVEARQLAGIRTQCLSEWLAIIASQNNSLATELNRWTSSDSAGRELPARLAHRIEPYTPLLLAMLGEAA